MFLLSYAKLLIMLYSAQSNFSIILILNFFFFVCNVIWLIIIAYKLIFITAYIANNSTKKKQTESLRFSTNIYYKHVEKIYLKNF